MPQWIIERETTGPDARTDMLGDYTGWADVHHALAGELLLAYRAARHDRDGRQEFAVQHLMLTFALAPIAEPFEGVAGHTTYRIRKVTA